MEEELKAGAEVNGFYGLETPIHTAVLKIYPLKRAKSEQITEIELLIEFLLGKGADINLQNKSHETVIALASESENALELIEFLLEKGADPNAGVPALFKCQSPKVAELLIKYGANVQKVYDGENALLAAVRNNNSDLVKFFLKKGLDKNFTYSGDLKPIRGYTALHFASESFQTELMDLLLDAGAEIKKDANGNYPGDLIKVNEASGFFERDTGIKMAYHALLKGKKKEEYFRTINNTDTQKNLILLSPKGTEASKTKCKLFYSYLGLSEYEKNIDYIKALKRIGAKKSPKDGTVLIGKCGG